MQVVSETCERKGSREVVTLHAVTTTPRRRTVTDSYERQCSPTVSEPAELYSAGRKRRKAESNARSRALCRLDASKQGAYLEKEKARNDARSYLPAWQVRELDAWKEKKEAELFCTHSTHRERLGWKRTTLGPRGWCDVDGWVWQTPSGRIVDLSRIVDYKGTEFYADWLWRNGQACGICACTECGITQHPCACKKPPDPDRANWARKHRSSKPVPTCVPAEWGIASTALHVVASEEWVRENAGLRQDINIDISWKGFTLSHYLMQNHTIRMAPSFSYSSDHDVVSYLG